MARKRAAEFLTAAGWQILDRNWRCSAGELDIVARDGTTLVVVEVKTRSGTGFGYPAEAVNHRKLARLRRLAGQWLAEHEVHPSEIRIDVVSVLASPNGPLSIEHLPGVA